MATATPIPLAEYLQTSFHPDRESVEGKLAEVFAELDELEPLGLDA